MQIVTHLKVTFQFWPFHWLWFWNVSSPDTAVVRINIVDENDNPPEFRQDLYEVDVPENQQVGTSILKVTATDADTGM